MSNREDEYGKNFSDEDFSVDSIIDEFSDKSRKKPSKDNGSDTIHPAADFDIEKVISDISNKYLHKDPGDFSSAKPVSFTVRLDMPEENDSTMSAPEAAETSRAAVNSGYHELLEEEDPVEPASSEPLTEGENEDNTQPETPKVLFDFSVWDDNPAEASLTSGEAAEEPKEAKVPEKPEVPEEPEVPPPNYELENDENKTSLSGMEQRILNFKLPSLNDAAVGGKSKSGDSNKKTDIRSAQTVPDDFAPVSFDVTDCAPEVTQYSKYASQTAAEDNAKAVDEALKGTPEEEKPNNGDFREPVGFFSRFVDMLSTDEDTSTEREDPPEDKATADVSGGDTYYDSDFPNDEGQYDDEDLELDNMSPSVAALHYSKGNSTLQFKGVVSLIMSLFMLYMCLSYDSVFPFPIDFSQNQLLLTGLLLLFQLFVMLIGLDVITAGISNIIRLKIDLDALVVITNVVCAADAAHMLIVGNAELGAPYSAVASFAIGCSLISLRLTRSALQTSLKTVSTASNPYVVTEKQSEDTNELMLLKVRRQPEGFLRMCQQMDFGEKVYSKLAPMIIIASVVFAALASVGRGNGSIFLHCFAAIIAVGTSLSGLISYGLPFSMLAKKLSRAGAAVGGWAGACNIHEATSAVILDKDVFPSGTLSISGIRVFRKSDISRVVSYTGSIIAESGSGLAEIFSELIARQRYTLYPISNFSCYEGGGIGAVVDGHEVVIGSSNFMNLMGIRLPKNLNVKNAVFTAIRGELVGVFSINYLPINSVQEALVSIFRTKIRPLFAIRDFNVTPLMIQHKFKISTDKIQFLSFEERYKISAQMPGELTKPSAVICREGLSPLADVITGGKRLRNAVCGNVIFSAVGSVLGMLIMFYLCFSGSFMAARPGNMLIFMLLWLIPVIVTSWQVRYN